MTHRCNTETIATMITANALPAILIGGPPNAGKSVLTHNLTRELRRCDVPHYVFRANPDIEGDWFLEGDLDTVRQIQAAVWDYRRWTDKFRELICHDLSRRHLPLIVDLGGRPNSDGKDHCIFRACTHSILLLKSGTEDDKEISQIWRDIVKDNSLLPLAELDSQPKGQSTLTSRKPIITGTLTGLERGRNIHGSVYNAIIDCIRQLFSSYSDNVLETLHLNDAPIEFVVHLPHQLCTLAPDTEEWTPDQLEPLLTKVPAQTALAVYGRAPNWVYGALALHAGTQAFHQFDALLGWVPMLTLRTGTSRQLMQSPLHIYPPHKDDGQYIIQMHPVHNYLDHTEADQLEFPVPPQDRGVIISGKLPLWLFTALARFYAQWNVPWIALHDARNNQAVVIYSRVETHPIGKTFLMPV